MTVAELVPALMCLPTDAFVRIENDEVCAVPVSASYDRGEVIIAIAPCDHDANARGRPMTVEELRASIGVSPSVAQKMIDLQANVILNDGTLLRTCEHGVRHPIGHIHPGVKPDSRHETRGEWMHNWCGCCEAQCCATWRTT